jgi:MFS family permease
VSDASAEVARPADSDRRGGAEARVAEPALIDERLLVGTMFTVFATVVANTTSGAVAQPAIAATFDAGAGDVGWIVFGYSAAFAVMTAVYGSLARRFGLVPCLVFGVVLVSIGAGVAVLAVNLPMLIVARIAQGVGAGAIPTLSMALLARRLSGPARARALGVNVAAVGVGFAAGPIFGGLLLDAFGWRGAMALGLLVAPAALVIWRFDRDRGSPTQSLDRNGIVLLAGAVACLVFLVNRVPVLGPSPAIGVAAAAFVTLGWLLLRHSRGREDAAFALDVVGDPRLRRVMALGFVGQTAFLGTLVIVPIAAARAHGVDGVMLGLILVPMAVVIGLLSPQNGRVEARIGRPATTAVALTAITAGALFLALAGSGALPSVLAGGLIAAGIGFAFLNAPLVNEVTRLYPGDRRSVALGIYNLAFFLGSAAGAAISTALVQASWDLPPFAGEPVAGYSTALVVLAAGPLAIAALGWLRRGQRPGGSMDLSERTASRIRQ